MKKVFLLFLCLTCIGCAHNTQPILYPNGKTDEDWLMDDKFCQIAAGKKTGPWGLVWPGNLLDRKQANEKYNACLREKGWLE